MIPAELLPIYFFMALGTVGVLMFFWLSPKRHKRITPSHRERLFKENRRTLTERDKAGLSEKIEQSRSETLKKMPAIGLHTNFMIVVTIVLTVLSIIFFWLLASNGFKKFLE